MIEDRITSFVADSFGVEVRTCTPLSGGDVARSFRVELADDRVVFAKTHSHPPPGFFTTEANGLRWLADADALPVAEVISVSDEPPVLVLAWIEEGGSTSPSGEAAFGRSLAELHRAGAPFFGREDRRSTGSRGLPNEPTDQWSHFYAEQRLVPLARLATDSGALSDRTVADVEQVASRLPELGGPDEKPSRLHGDLWAGNRLIDRGGVSWLIDPAAHGGHREFDLAMMRLFGGFGAEAFAAYHESFPLADGWAERVALHQLAPLVVHAIKFGGGYVGAVERALSQYV